MAETCIIPECTVAQTGTCLKNNDAATCPNRAVAGDGTEDDIGLPPLKGPSSHPRFPSSLALGMSEMRELAASRYCHMIGVLGLPGSGKTAALVSAYLLLSRGKLKGFDFLDSRSLRAFDDISHGARVWKEGQRWEDITAHTELSDDRTPGFMHLRVRRTSDDRVFDLLLPDLPGEWSTSLIDTDRSDRWQFLQGADVLWIVIDGDELKKTRNLLVHRTQLLLARLAATLTRRPPVTLVITRRDHGSPDEAAMSALINEANRLGFSASTTSIASFKNGAESSPGFGISELIASVGAKPTSAVEFWPSMPRRAGRMMTRFRNAEQ